MGLRKVCCCLCQTACIVLGICEIIRSLFVAALVMLLLIGGPHGIPKSESWTEGYIEFVDRNFEEVVDPTRRENLEEFFSTCEIFAVIGLALSVILLISSSLMIFGACHKRRGFFLPMLITSPIQLLYW